ncbi:condensation domain-containing protein [Consotaella salsifontis]|uniref:Thioesterase domain-containing protein n=1 Tax=Consotaella salsifontis TaxID=1365950 RepID=A0A1T4SXJ5_9HYPH|nr:condensation domain-containing protein [Consotaella salsifontis]SKA32896.1 Thioesterase domain-containing protein [Consotaella salsifontis]
MISQAHIALEEDVDVIGTFPCSASQERFWFLDQFSPGNPALNVAVRWEIRGAISAANIEEAFRGVIARHEILRTRFLVEGGRPVQQVMRNAEFRITEVDIRAIPAAEREARMQAIAMEDGAKPFDLGRPGLIRAILIRLSNDRAILAITAHHICFDGWSIGILGREFGRIAAALDSGRDPGLPELPLQYADYALWQRAYFASDAFAEEVEEWRRQLADAPYFELEPDHPRTAQRTYRCDSATADLPPAFGERLEAEAHRRAMSPFAFGYGVLSAMLCAVAGGSPEVLLGTQLAGRSDVDLEGLIGVFINSLVLRLETSLDRSIDQHLKNADAVVKAALVRQNTPFNKLVEIVNPPRDPSRTPLVSINFQLQHAFMENARYGRMELLSVPSHAPGAIYDLNFVMVGRPNGWRMALEYNADLFDRATAENLLEHWQSAFAIAFEHSEKTIGEMGFPVIGTRPRISDAERLARIEQTLLAHDLVDHAAAIFYVDNAGQRRIQAFVTASPDAAIPVEGLPARLLADLSAEDGMEVPDGISVLHDLPRKTPVEPQPSSSERPMTLPAHGVPAMPVDATLEAKVAQIWEQVLGVSGVSAASNFFDLGGHSLLTVRMIAQVRKEFGCSLDLPAVYRNPTLRAITTQLASAMAATAPAASTAIADETADWRIVEMQTAGPGIPVITINNVGIIHAITKTTARNRRMVCVRLFEPGRDHGLSGLSLEQIASRYLEVVQAIRPKGPYVLLGECVHGVLAYEVAQQLLRRGEHVALLVTLNMWHPTYSRRLSSKQRWQIRLSQVSHNFKHVRAGKKTFVQFLGNYSLPHRLGLFRAARALGLLRAIPPRTGSAEQEDFLMTLFHARDQYVPAPYEGPILQMLTPDCPTGRGFDPTLGWDGVFTGPVTLSPVEPLGTIPTEGSGRRAIAEVVADTLVDVDASLGGSRAK